MLLNEGGPHMLKITLKNGKAIKNASLLNEGDEIITRLYKGEVVSVVTNKLSKK